MVRPVTKQEKNSYITLFQLLALCSVAWFSNHENKLAFTDNASSNLEAWVTYAFCTRMQQHLISLLDKTKFNYFEALRQLDTSIDNKRFSYVWLGQWNIHL